MLPKITIEELDLFETLCNPIAAAECLFSDLENDNLAAFDERFSQIRLGQFPMLSYEYLIDYDPNLTVKENFKLREGSGTIYALGSRKHGKTMCVEKVDIPISVMNLDAETAGFTSADLLHIRGILEPLINCFENHPIFKVFGAKIQRHPSYRFTFNTGYVLEGINMNIKSSNPGQAFFAKHLTRLYIEEQSLESDSVYKKRIDSVSENGCVMRGSGMCNFTKYSPTGRLFYDQKNKNKIVNLPQFVSPKWDKVEEEEAIKKHGGKESISFRVFVLGEVVEDGISVIDMDRVREQYNEKKEVKHFEVSKETYHNFENQLVIERVKNASSVFICADIGETAPTEIMIIFEVPTKDGNKYSYTHNITLNNLTEPQQFKIFKYLSEQLGSCFIAIDTTVMGRSIYRSLEEILPKENLIWVAFNEKLPVGFEKDNEGKVIIKNGVPSIQEEYVSEWSIKRIKHLLYERKMLLPLDYKFDEQLNSLISMQSGTRTIYKCISPENHLLQAFQCFAIAQWYKEFKESKPVNGKNFAKTGVW